MANQPDVSSTLSDLERKLRDLERELTGAAALDPVPPRATAPALAPQPLAHEPPASVARADGARAAVPPVPVIPPVADPEARRVLAEAKASLSGLHHQLDDLVRVRQELERSTRELMDEYSRVLSAFGETDARPPGAAAAAPAFTPAPAFAPGPPPAPAPAPVAAATAVPAAPGAADHELFSGQVTVDAGPFTDIATLSAFEQALGQVPGTKDVYVRGFEGSRALIDVVLGSSVALGTELRRSVQVDFSLVTTGPQSVSITIDGGQHA